MISFEVLFVKPPFRPYEWFHFDCVGVAQAPKGKWYCPQCRGSSSATMAKPQCDAWATPSLPFHSPSGLTAGA